MNPSSPLDRLLLLKSKQPLKHSLHGDLIKKERLSLQLTKMKEKIKNNNLEHFSEDQENINPNPKISHRPPKKLEKTIKNLVDEVPPNLDRHIRISKKNVDYGLVLSGFRLEEDLQITNISKNKLVILLKVESEEFLGELEPVFAFRRVENNEYREKSVVVIEPNNSVMLKILLNVPVFKEKIKINGRLNVSVLGWKPISVINLTSKLEIPRIQCLKSLFDCEEAIESIRLTGKKCKKIDFKIPFRNLNVFGMTLEIDFLKNDDENYLLTTIYNFTTINGNSVFLLNVSLKERLYDESERKEIRDVLMLKVKNSKIIFAFGISIEITA